MPTQPTPAERIRTHLQGVADLRRQSAADAALAGGIRTVKRLQARRFQGTYQDLLRQEGPGAAVRFFLDELYGEHDFSRRDEQFSRIAGALERLFPSAVSELAVNLSEIHALTEDLDHRLALEWLRLDRLQDSERYVQAWRLCAARPERDRQLAVVQRMGHELQRLTRMRSLRMGLRMMRKPAHAAGLQALQHFLETGFDAFASLRDASAFQATVEARERTWIERLFDAPMEEACRRLDAEWLKAGP